jgi:hypothetical protein
MAAAGITDRFQVAVEAGLVLVCLSFMTGLGRQCEFEASASE